MGGSIVLSVVTYTIYFVGRSRCWFGSFLYIYIAIVGPVLRRRNVIIPVYRI